MDATTHCPVTVVQRYRDGVCSLLFHLFFIICHPYIPLHLEEMIFYTCIPNIEPVVHCCCSTYSYRTVSHLLYFHIASLPEDGQSKLMYLGLGELHQISCRPSFIFPQWGLECHSCCKGQRAISRVETRRFVTTRKVFLWLEKGP